MKKMFWAVVIILDLISFYFLLWRPDILVGGIAHADNPGPCAGYPNGVCESCTIGQCVGKDAMPPNPERPYFDACGNEYNYLGVLISPGNGCAPDLSSNTTEPFNGK